MLFSFYVVNKAENGLCKVKPIQVFLFDKLKWEFRKAFKVLLQWPNKLHLLNFWQS